VLLAVRSCLKRFVVDGFLELLSIVMLSSWFVATSSGKKSVDLGPNPFLVVTLGEQSPY